MIIFVFLCNICLINFIEFYSFSFDLIHIAAEFTTYATVKLESVKSTTVVVKGCNPSWEQDFILWVFFFYPTPKRRTLFGSEFIPIFLFSSHSFLLSFDFHHSETSRLDTNLIIELWNKGILWDKIIGYLCVPLNKIPMLENVCIHSLLIDSLSFQKAFMTVFFSIHFPRLLLLPIRSFSKPFLS